MVKRIEVSPDAVNVAYEASGNRLGWRLLTSPAAVIDGADIAFIGMNPGGREEPTDHPKFAPRTGSAYTDECWAGCAPGRNRLQVQVQSLFNSLGVEPQNVLAGNLVPFRSPDWQSLVRRKDALAYGKQLWTEIFRRARPRLIIGLGGEVDKCLRDILNADRALNIPLGWGRVTGSCASFDGGLLIRLPHLSRFGVITRTQSQAGLRSLFKPYWQS